MPASLAFLALVALPLNNGILNMLGNQIVDHPAVLFVVKSRAGRMFRSYRQPLGFCHVLQIQAGSAARDGRCPADASFAGQVGDSQSVVGLQGISSERRANAARRACSVVRLTGFMRIIK